MLPGALLDEYLDNVGCFEENQIQLDETSFINKMLFKIK